MTQQKPSLRKPDPDAMRKALAFLSIEVGDTILDDIAWTLIRRAAGVDEVLASPREVVEALGFTWHEVNQWYVDYPDVP